MCEYTFLSLGVDSIGLILDVIGAILVLIYAIPIKVNTQGEAFVAPGSDVAKYKKFFRLGISLLILGFLLQIVSNILPQRFP